MYDDDYSDFDDELDEDQIWERERKRDVIETRRGIWPEFKVECRHCNQSCPYVLSASGKRMLLHPGTGRKYAWLDERPGGDYIAVTSPTQGFVVRNFDTADDLYGYTFFEHHALLCPVLGPVERRKRAEDRRAYRLKRKFEAPQAPDTPPSSWEIEVDVEGP